MDRSWVLICTFVTLWFSGIVVSCTLVTPKNILQVVARLIWPLWLVLCMGLFVIYVIYLSFRTLLLIGLVELPIMPKQFRRWVEWLGEFRLFNY